MKIKLENILGVKIKDISLFELAFTHKSAVNEYSTLKFHNERIEFLGDAVLELVVTEYLYKHFPDMDEGKMTNLRASLVKGKMLAEIAKELKLGQFLKISKWEEKFWWRKKSSILANTMESILGAVYLDTGIKNAEKIILTFIVPKLEEIMKKGSYMDAKTSFQQIIQDKFRITPNYKLISDTGPDHDKIFEIAVMVNDKEYWRGKGNSKQNAEQAAAENALEQLKSKNLT